MKFMKLGNKPDAFQSDGKTIRYLSTELDADVIIKVGEVQFYLHKYPLLSKSNHLQKLVSKATNEEKVEEVCMDDFPGGAKSFEICAKFCYGMTVTLNAYNIVAARCAAEYLEMTEDVDRSNLIYKIEVFLNSSIFRSWKDTIIVLQNTKPLLSWCEDLKIVGRCIDSIASKTSVDPSSISWSYTYNRKLAQPDKIIEEINYREKMDNVPRDWWVEDICDLDIDLYKRVMLAVKSKGRMDGAVIGEALKTYGVRWLPDSVDALVSDEHALRNKSLVETIVCLLPSEKGVGCPCSFLLKLLKVAILVGADESLREVLVNRISLKLHEARVCDLLIPARSPQLTIYDVELVQSVVNQFVIHEKSNWNFDIVEKNEKGADHFILGHGSLLSVGRLIDGYLAEIAHDPNLDVGSFIDLSQSIPDLARPIHDGLYKAIDIYLKEHPGLTKAERKKVCGLMDVKKLTTEASMNAAQNEQLPLRVVVQVLFFEQVRSSAGARFHTNNTSDASHSTTNLDEECDKATEENCKPLGKQLSQIKITEDFRKNGKLCKKNSKSSRSGAQLLPSRSRRIFDKLWSVGKGHGENKSSETSASSQSPTSIAPGDSKSVSSSRHRRHSIS